jgi:hypothetical protein
VYDSHKKLFWDAHLPEWMDAFHTHATVERFTDNNRAFWQLHYTNFPGTPQPVVAEPRTPNAA